MRTSFILAALVAMLAVGFGCGKGDSPNPREGPKFGEVPQEPVDPRTDCKQNDCTAPPEWFPITPPVKADFPKIDADECDFYKWAWQSFLYLTQPETDGDPPRFILLDTPNELFDAAGGKKLQIAAAPTRDRAKKRMLSLSVRNSPGTTHNVQAKAFAQAGSQGVVVDRNNRCLYYGQHINSAFVDFIRNTLGLKTADQIKDVDPNKEFPPGCLELKSAWRVLTDDEKKPENLTALRQSYFITEALVPTLINVTTGSVTVIKADETKPRPEMVALAALHVVGTTPGHPEFVWASFEHVENSPTQMKLLDPTDPAPVDAAKDYTFYRKGTPTNKSNLNPVPDENTTPPVLLTLLDATKQTLSPIVDIYREFNSGDDFIKPDDDVCTLNGSVRTKLKATPSLSVWSSYQLIGAVWLKNPAMDFAAGKRFVVRPTPNVTFAGEIRLSNSTMETFTQHKQFNCFGCHDTFKVSENGKDLPGLKIKISHVIRNAFIGPTN
jgi:hypothetical protein